MFKVNMVQHKHVTVLMSVYNGAKTVQKAIESIQSQTYPNWDLLVIDDCSTDKTPAMLQSIAATDSRVSVIRNSVNRGLATSLNIGWKQAQGTLIARMDADDTSLPDRLMKQVLFMQAHPDIAVLGTGAILIDEQGAHIGVARRPESHNEITRTIYTGNPLIHPSVLLRKSFLVAMDGYKETLRRAQDYDLWLRGYRHFRFYNLADPLIYYKMPTIPSLQDIQTGAWALLQALCREQRLMTHSYYLARYIAWGVLVKIRLWRIRPR